MTTTPTCPQTGAPCATLVPIERHLKEVFGERFTAIERAALAEAAEAARDEVREQVERFALKSDVDGLKSYVAAARGRSSAAIVVAGLGLAVTVILSILGLVLK